MKDFYHVTSFLANRMTLRLNNGKELDIFILDHACHKFKKINNNSVVIQCTCSLEIQHSKEWLLYITYIKPHAVSIVLFPVLNCLFKYSIH